MDAVALGAPQWGQLGARSLMDFPQSSHVTNAMRLSSQKKVFFRNLSGRARGYGNESLEEAG